MDLANENDRSWYLGHSSSLTQDFKGETDIEPQIKENCQAIKLNLVPEGFFVFGAGYGDNEVDMVPVSEKVIVWEGSKASIKDKAVLIPASSIKGAIAHRVAYHYNKKMGYHVGNPEAKTGDDNLAVQVLFGYSVDGKPKRRGIVLFEDIIESDSKVKEKVFNHVAIDRFTGGALDGALYSEKAHYGNNEVFSTTITILENITDTNIEYAFNAALKDLKTGMLPLGGGVNKGFGCFKEYKDLK